METKRRLNLRMIIGLVVIVNDAFLLKLSDGETCPVIMKEARISCLDRPQTQFACESAGCCWDETSDDPETKCYAKECKSGYFGWQCKFQCQCEEGGNAKCNRYTGECEHGCAPERWGVGCLLESNCSYNDPDGVFYTGKKSKTVNNRPCVNWSLKKIYNPEDFPEKNIAEAVNYCRNPRHQTNRTWCYWILGESHRSWEYCTLQACECPEGRFGINCVSECHCQNGDYCDPATGICSSGRCDAHWTGNNCQDCSDGYFGITCESKCRCNSSAEVCDKGTGHCQSGCALGWKEQDCHTATVPKCITSIPPDDKYSIVLHQSRSVEFHCTFTYKGNWAPTTEWRKYNSTDLVHTGVPRTIQNGDVYRVISTLSITFNPEDNGIRYIYQLRYDESKRPPTATAHNVPDYSFNWISPTVIMNENDDDSIEGDGLKIIWPVLAISVLIVIVLLVLLGLLLQKRKGNRRKIALDVIQGAVSESCNNEPVYAAVEDSGEHTRGSSEGLLESNQATALYSLAHDPGRGEESCIYSNADHVVQSDSGENSTVIGADGTEYAQLQPTSNKTAAWFLSAVPRKVLYETSEYAHIDHIG